MTIAIGTYISAKNGKGEEIARVVHVGGNQARIYRLYQVWKPEKVLEWKVSEEPGEIEVKPMNEAQIAAMSARPSGIMSI